MEQIVRLPREIWENDVALVFSIAIVVLFFVALQRHAFGKGEQAATIDKSAPMLLTTLGVLGTFTGIFIGLLDFDVADIDKSVPDLLTGLKIAFSTSIVGMGAAILFRVAQSVVPRPFEVGEVGPEQIYRVLSDIRKNGERQSEAISTVRQAIAGDDESSLVTQLQKLRTSVLDGDRAIRDTLDKRFQEQIEEFRKFAETMAENNTKALIEALEQVIRDFNAQLNEQFGENFKQLNEAVGALLTWQERYRDHVEKLEARLETAVAAVERSEKALAQIAEHTATIPDTMEALKGLLTGLQQQVTNIEAHLEAIAALKDRAVQAFPVIEENLKKLTDGFRTNVEGAVEEIRQTLSTHKEAYDTLQKGFGSLHEKVEQTADEFRVQVERMLSNQAQAIETTMEETRQVLRNSVEQTGQAIEEEIKAFDEQMQREVGRVIETMGRGLASLSEKFVEDYAPLTDRLRDIVNMTRGV